MINDPQDHLSALRAAGLVEEYVWDRENWHVTLPGNDVVPERTLVTLRDDDIEAFATAMAHGALMASQLNARQVEDLHFYVQEER